MREKIEIPKIGEALGKHYIWLWGTIADFCNVMFNAYKTREDRDVAYDLYYEALFELQEAQEAVKKANIRIERAESFMQNTLNGSHQRDVVSQYLTVPNSKKLYDPIKFAPPGSAQNMYSDAIQMTMHPMGYNLSFQVIQEVRNTEMLAEMVSRELSDHVRSDIKQQVKSGLDKILHGIRKRT